MTVVGKVESLWRYPVKSMRGEEAENTEPGMTPVYATAANLVVDIETPSGEVLAIDDPAPGVWAA
jgi:hypothetical protein